MIGKRRTQLITFVLVLILVSALLGGCAGTKATIRSITPKTGQVGITLAILGNNFGAINGKSAVRIGGAPCKVSSWSDTSVSASVPGSLSAGNYPVLVITAVGNSNSVAFSVTKGITAFSLLQAMLDYFKKKGVGTAGVAFSVALAAIKQWREYFEADVRPLVKTYGGLLDTIARGSSLSEQEKAAEQITSLVSGSVTKLQDCLNAQQKAEKYLKANNLGK
jgi:IPT/TIG domain